MIKEGLWRRTAVPVTALAVGSFFLAGCGKDSKRSVPLDTRIAWGRGSAPCSEVGNLSLESTFANPNRHLTQQSPIKTEECIIDTKSPSGQFPTLNKAQAEVVVQPVGTTCVFAAEFTITYAGTARAAFTRVGQQNADKPVVLSGDEAITGPAIIAAAHEAEDDNIRQYVASCAFGS